ncbi:hypothetical protein APUTEX25_000940 [Auxenochlorella protothecoides]|uniref:Hexosyltransferase n=2 Tax=Auxenochlorella protothecoides TaxID=3075 RepID=A0A3M7KQL0_AUXPR|nr:hypothetical protein APUTEX25_000940 [Auxenochlorella protothecoides]|eukprot:RMZ52821.1 hypothetical protein APUTEX25_000940 [Auxenochlorella protothecoides]
MQVAAYVNGILAAQGGAGQAAPVHAAVLGLCGLSPGTKHFSNGFSIALPRLPTGVHELRVLASLDNSTWQEANASPMLFEESTAHPDAKAALARKDAIILQRNAQLAALWAERAEMGPWQDRPRGKGPEGVASAVEKPGNATNLVVIAVNTGLGSRDRRDILRRTWFPKGTELAAWEARGVVVRFVVGTSVQANDPLAEAMRTEAREFGDVVEMPEVIDTYGDLSLKTQHLFTTMLSLWDADFYFKVDDDVALNLEALSDYLTARRMKKNLYLGCMKSGQVLTDSKWKWYEPEHWRFGDALGPQGINYMRHATGQAYGLSRPVAQYIARNAHILHRYANEDVSVGAWMLGLEVELVHDLLLCCSSAAQCREQTTPEKRCLVFSEVTCAGICQAETRLEPIWKSCLEKPYEAVTLATFDQTETSTA